MNITRGKIRGAKKIIIYGPEGIGKSTFASQFPDPVFIDTEGSTKELDVARFDPPSSWQMLLEQVQYVKKYPDVCKTLVIDTADWAEKLEIEELCRKNGWNGLEGAGYGKGYTYAAEEFGRFLNLLEEVVSIGINVVITAHAQLRKVELPEEMGAYDHWEMKTSKKVAPMIREWADMVLFANYKTIVVNVDNQGAAKGKNKAQGGRRVMYTTHTPFWDAKNRYGLPEELPFEYNAIRHVVEASQEATAASEKPSAREADKVTASKPESRQEPSQPVTQTQEAARVAEKPSGDFEQMSMKSMEKSPQETARAEPAGNVSVSEAKQEPDPRIPKALRNLMIANDVGEWDLENIMGMDRGSGSYVPEGTKVWEFEKIAPGIIDGMIIPYWKDICKAIMEVREKQEIPFN